MSSDDYYSSFTAKSSPEETYKKISQVAKWWSENFEGSSAKVEDSFTLRFKNGDWYKIKVVELDIDNYGSVIPVRELELSLPEDDSVIKILSSSKYAAIFTEGDSDIGRTIILANSISLDELNEEKKRAIDKVNRK